LLACLCLALNDILRFIQNRIFERRVAWERNSSA
jgi:hypothetical protein